MGMDKLAVAAQIIVAASVFFVWIFRFPNVEKEFNEYGLPVWVRSGVGAVKVAISTLLLAGIWYPRLVLPAAFGMAFFMLCAQGFHVKARHPFIKYVPSFVLLVLSLFVAAVAAGLLPR